MPNFVRASSGFGELIISCVMASSNAHPQTLPGRCALCLALAVLAGFAPGEQDIRSRLTKTGLTIMAAHVLVSGGRSRRFVFRRRIQAGDGHQRPPRPRLPAKAVCSRSTGGCVAENQAARFFALGVCDDFL
jgi:hypothetical protein